MANNDDSFQWARRLECPSFALTDPICKSLHQGISSLLLDELAGVLHPVEDVLTVRKNILLHKLRHGEKDTSFENIEDIVKIKLAKSNLDTHIDNLEEKCKESDFITRKKKQELSKIKSQRHLLKVKENLLRMKLKEVLTQVRDCKETLSICKHLKPPGNCDITPNIVDENLKLASNISTRSDKKMALNKISENLGNIDLHTLWNVLLAKRTRDTEELMELVANDIPDKSTKNVDSIDISIARSLGQYIATAVREQIHCMKSNRHGEQLMELINKIEAVEAKNPYVSKWLAVALEVCKLESEEQCLETEIDRLKSCLEEQPSLDDEHSNLSTELYTLNEKIENCVGDIQKSLVLLKTGGLEVARTRDKLEITIQRIAALRDEKQDSSYMQVNPCAELHMFNDEIKLEALGKIVLKDSVGVYRHRKFCISKALQTITAPFHVQFSSQFPMIQAPIYRLLNGYKLLMMDSWLKKLESESSSSVSYDLNNYEFHSAADFSDETIELLDHTDLTCDTVRGAIEQFNTIFDAWKYQNVQKVMTLDDRIVNGLSYNEWVKRYELMLHMLKKSK